MNSISQSDFELSVDSVRREDPKGILCREINGTGREASEMRARWKGLSICVILYSAIMDGARGALRLKRWPRLRYTMRCFSMRLSPPGEAANPLHRTIGPRSMFRIDSTTVRTERTRARDHDSSDSTTGKPLDLWCAGGGMGILDRPAGHIVQKKKHQVTGQGSGTKAHPTTGKGDKGILWLHVHGQRQ